MAKSQIVSRKRTKCWGDPPIFHSDEEAIQWGIGQGIKDAPQRYRLVKQRYSDYPWPVWIGVVGNLLQKRDRV